MSKSACPALELRAHIANWREAQEIRAHVGACQAVAALQRDPDSRAAEWLKWASQHADRIDPISGWKRDVEQHEAGRSR